jgi:pilus assembly protein FimV
LWEIATRHIEDAAISPQQMMLALFHANLGAFADSNINRLKTGYVLRIPTREEILATRFEDAVTEVAQQNALWHGDRAGLASQPTSPTPPQAQDESVAAAPPEQPPAAPPAPSEREGAETLADNEVLRTRIATLEERLTTLDHIITVQHGQLTELQQRLAQAQRRPHASTPTPTGREGRESAAPDEETTQAAGATKPTTLERPTVGLTWLTAPKIIMAVSGVVLLGLVLIWLRRRQRMTVHQEAAEAVTATVVQASMAQPDAAEEDALRFDHGDLETVGEGVAEVPLAALIFDVDDLELGPDPGGEAAIYDEAASHRLPNMASSSRKAGDASP